MSLKITDMERAHIIRVLALCHGNLTFTARTLGFSFIGIELSEEYLAISEKRIAHV